MYGQAQPAGRGAAASSPRQHGLASQVLRRRGGAAPSLSARGAAAAQALHEDGCRRAEGASGRRGDASIHDRRGSSSSALHYTQLGPAPVLHVQLAALQGEGEGAAAGRAAFRRRQGGTAAPAAEAAIT